MREKKKMYFVDAVMYVVLLSYLILVFVSWYRFTQAKLKIVLFFALGFSTLLTARVLYITMGYTEGQVYITLLELASAIYFVAGMMSV